MFREAGGEVRGLEGEGDHLVRFARTDCDGMGMDCQVSTDYVTLFSEVKRQERLQLWQWLAQAQSEAPAGTVPVVSFRRNRGQWYACLPLRDLLRLV